MSEQDSKAPRRGRRPRPATERKDRVVQTRVPQDLEATLKDAADHKRVTVSQLIRNVLEDTFTLVDHIVADSASIVNTVARDARRLAANRREPAPAGTGASRGAANRSVTDDSGTDDPGTDSAAADGALPPPDATLPLDEVDSWQDVIINRAGQCARCGTGLARGQQAFRGLTIHAGAPPVWLCTACIRAL